jgi:ubiquinone/menaquinone biosynthesis C-methylase UbiE
MRQSIAFDRAADFYDATRGLPPPVMTRITDAVAQAGGITAQTALLEIGVGTGRMALPLVAATGARLVGVDLSMPMLAKLCEKQTTEPVWAVRGDVMHLPLPDATFDRVLAAHIFHLVGDANATLQEVARVLRPGGALLFTWQTYGRNPFSDALDASRRTDKRLGFRGTGFLERAGWQPTARTIQVDYARTTTPRTHIQWMRDRVWSSQWTMSDADLQARIDKVMAAIVEQGLGMDETVELPITFNVAPFRPRS